MNTFAELAFTPAVKALQDRHGSRAAYARHERHGGPGEDLGPDEVEFLARADHFFLATVGETGWPYVQHRGGPRGFLRVLSGRRLAFADFAGNRQYVSAGNAASSDKASLIVMDWARQARLKLLGHLRFVPRDDAEPQVLAQVGDPAYPARIERIGVIEVEAFDWNCPKHITPRYTREEIAALRLDPDLSR